MNTSHARQRDEAVLRSLTDAGIRQRFHRMSLEHFASPHAARLLGWIKAEAKANPSQGFVFVGGNDLEDLAVLVARGLHVTGHTVRVRNLLRLQQRLEENWRDFEDDLDGVQTLLVTHAGPRAGEKGEVFTQRQLRDVEAFLDDWLSDGNRLLLHTAQPLQSSWFSTEFVQRVAKLNESIR